MASLTLNRAEAEDGRLPGLCLRCGAPATSTDRKQFAWHPPWVFLLIFAGLLPMIIVGLCLTKRMWVEAPFCEQHRKHWSWRRYLVSGGVIALIAAGAAWFILSAGNFLPDPLGGWMCAGLGLATLALLVLSIVLQVTSIAACEITASHITLKRVAEEFSDALRNQRAASLRNWTPEDLMIRRPSGANVGLIVVLAVLGLGGLLMIVALAAITTIGSRANAQFSTVGANLPVVDNANGFRLDAPGGRWRLLTPTQARNHNALASAGAEIGSGEFMGLILVENDPNFDIQGAEQDFARRMIDSSSLTDKRTESIRAVTFLGEPAVRYRYTAKVDFTRARIENTTFANKGKIYQLHVAGPAGSNCDAEFQQFVDAFKLLP